MKPTKIIVTAGCAALTLAFSSTISPAAPATPDGAVTDIGIQQQRVQRDFLELQRKVTGLIDDIMKTDPDRARRLREALEWAGQQVLAGRLGSAADMLNAGKLMEAGEIQPQMLADLQTMQKMLQRQPTAYEELQAQIALFQKWRDTILDLSQEQWRLTRDSERSSDPEAEQKRLAEQITRVEDLIAAQKELRDRTKEALARGQFQLDREAKEQRKLARETTALLSSIRREDQPPTSDEPDKPGQSGQPGESGKPGQAKGSGTPQDGEESRHPGGGSARPGRENQSDQNPPEDTPPKAADLPPETRAPEAGERPTTTALGEQWLSAENLAKQKPEASRANQEKALQNLEFALREIKYERMRQENLTRQNARADQQTLAKLTAKLFEDIVNADPKNAEAGSTPSTQSPGGKPNPNNIPGEAPSVSSPYVAPGSQGKPRPGAREVMAAFPRGFSTGGQLRPGGVHPQSTINATPRWNNLANSVHLFRPLVNQANQLMLKATDSLGTDPLIVAAPAQRNAYIKLAVAAQDLEQRLQDTKDIQRDELRPLLKQMLEQMLVKQQAASLRTLAMDEARKDGKLTDEQRQDIATIRTSEVEVGDLAQETVDSVFEDGSTVVFGGLLVELQQSVAHVVSLLTREETGPPTRNTQQEIEHIIASLIVATEQNVEIRIPTDATRTIKQSRAGKAAALIPLGTELRLLKAHQARINERTIALQAGAAAVPQEKESELQRLSGQQRRLHEMAKDVIRGLLEHGEEVARQVL